jgi:hypothetical protein
MLKLEKVATVLLHLDEKPMFQKVDQPEEMAEKVAALFFMQLIPSQHY